MRHPYDKIMRLEMIALGLSIVTGILALIQASLLFIILCFYFSVLSLACDAFSHLYTSHRQVQGLKQAIRAAILFIVSTALIFIL